jgi:hypothetical protein
MARGRHAYTAPMVASLLAALACAIAAPQSRPADHGSSATIAALVDADAGASRALAMSLPAEPGLLSSSPLATVVWSDGTPRPNVTEPREPLTSRALADPGAPPTLRDVADRGALLTPLEVDCVDVTSYRADWSALATRLDDGGSCCLFIPAGQGRTAMLRAPRGRSSRHVGAGAIGAAPTLLVPESHAPPILWPARLASALTPTVAPLTLPPPAIPSSPTRSRIDRPPRS